MTSSWVGSHHGAIRALAVVGTVALAAALGLVKVSMTQSTAAMVLVLAVVAAAATGDRWAGVLAAVTAAGTFDYFLTVPYGSLAIRDRDDVELALALVAVGLIVTELALWGQRQRAAALERDGYLRGLAQLVDLPGVRGHDVRAARVAAVADAITELLGADRSEWVDAPPHWNDAVVDHDGVVRRAGTIVRVEQFGLPTDGWTAVPAGGAAVGHFRVTTASRMVRPGRERLRVAYLAASTVRPAETVRG